MATKEEVIDYVMTTPGNPNKAVLSGMLDGIADAGGDVQPLIVKMTRTADYYNDTDVLFVADATTSEIKNALFAGRPVIANIISKTSSGDVSAAWVATVTFVAGQLLVPLATWSYAGKYSISQNPGIADTEWKLSIEQE